MKQGIVFSMTPSPGFLIFVLAKGIAKTASGTNMEAKEIWMLSARGERVIARL